MLSALVDKLIWRFVSRRSREECTRLLTLLVSATQRLIKPYALPMLRALLPKANDSNPTVASNILMCMGELACVGGEDILPHVPEIMDVILTRLTDPLPIKRDSALNTLGQVCSSTGYVIQPYLDHTELMATLGRILTTVQTPTVRREVMKVLGILGALDPYRRKVIGACIHPLGSHTNQYLCRRSSKTTSVAKSHCRLSMLFRLIRVLRQWRQMITTKLSSSTFSLESSETNH